MADFQIDDTVDITDVVCPVTFVKAKVALEELDDGQILSIHMNDGEPVQNVPRSIKEEGHKILKLLQNEDGTYDLIEWLHVSHRIRSGKKCWKQRDWYWRTFIPTAAFPVSGFRRFWRNWKKHTAML